MKNKRYKIPKLPNGGQFWKDTGNIAMNLGRGYIDANLGALGMDNVIQDDAYTGKGSQFGMQTADIAGQIGKAALPFALQAVGVPTQATQAGQQVLGSFNPQSTTNPEDVNYNTKRIANAGSSIVGPGLSMMRKGGIMKYNNGGINAEVEKQENTIAPDGEFTQYDGPSHENGGVKTYLEPGEMIFSDKLKLGKKTFAKLNEPYNTNKEDKILEDKKKDNYAKITAQLMKEAKLKQSMSLFEQQEALKQDKLNNYAKRLGITSNEFKNGGVQKYPGGGIYPGYNPNTSGHMLAAGQKPLGEAELTQLGYTHPTNNNEQWWNANTGRFYKAYSPGQPGYIDPNKYMNQGAPVLGDTEVRITNNQIPSNNNTPNPIDGIPRKPIEFGTAGAYNPNTGLLTESTGYNRPIQTQTFNYRNGGIKKYANGDIYTPNDNLPEYLPQQNIALGSSPIMNDILQPTNLGIQGDPYDLTRGLTNTQSSGSNDYSQLLNIGSQILQGVGQNVGNIYDLNRAKDTEVESYGRINPTLLNNEATVANNKRLYRSSLDNLKGAVQGNSSSYIQSRIAMDNNRMSQDALSQQQIDNLNAGILNQTQGANINLDIAEKTANAQNRAASRNLKGSAYSNIGQNIMSQNRDNNATKMDEKTLNAIIASNPRWANSVEGKAYIAQFRK